jgi:hypothetical protein
MRDMGEMFLQLVQKLGNIIPSFFLFFSPFICASQVWQKKERKRLG